MLPKGEIMFLRQIGKIAPKSTLLLALCLFLLMACGSHIGASPGASATATACARTAQSRTFFRSEIGTLKSINEKTFVLTSTQGKSIAVTYSSSTTFTREARIAASALKEGTPVSIVVTSTGNTYTAVSIMTGAGTATSANGRPGSGSGGVPATNGTPAIISGGPGGAPGGNETSAPSMNSGNGSNPCLAKAGGGKAPAGTNNTNSHTLTGTVSQVNGNILTITDYTGAPYTVTLTAQTQIIGTQSTSAAALKVGEPLTVVGKSDSQNTIAASTIEILLRLPGPASSPLI